MITFYPGPSRVSSKLPKYFRDAYLDGVMTINHRSPGFESIYSRCVALLKQKLHIPESYTIFFTSSATECWEIIAQSLIRSSSFHIYNGAFGEKWFLYTRKIKDKAQGYQFDINDTLKPGKLNIPDKPEIVCLTQNETSNGTQVANTIIKKIRKKYADKLIAIDATSSMAGIYLDFHQADIWYASVQKCFGLPAGMAVMVCSPAALEKAERLGENDHYNSLLFMMEKASLNQTTYTPNVLNIYFLMRVMDDAPDIYQTDKKLSKRFKAWNQFLASFNEIDLFIKNKGVRSSTVITLTSTTSKVAEIKKNARKGGIILGNGYGALKNHTFRIANFPSIKKKEIRLLKEFLRNNVR